MSFLTIKDLMNSLQVSKSTIYRWIHERGFPEPIKFSEKASRWESEEVNRWISELSGNNF